MHGHWHGQFEVLAVPSLFVLMFGTFQVYRCAYPNCEVPLPFDEGPIPESRPEHAVKYSNLSIWTLDTVTKTMTANKDTFNQGNTLLPDKSVEEVIIEEGSSHSVPICSYCCHFKSYMFV